MHRLFLLSVDCFFPKLMFSHKSSRKNIIETESLDQDQDRRLVRPDLVPKCLRMLPENERIKDGLVTVKTFGLLSSRLYTLLEVVAVLI